eukprot:TRINITY_DN2609_c0_g1_i3.p1 TRINITY_DN2609_c0_g1~~TRINITY_DN2609_c0_g1_i3.p1  ORF type:complete len:160 (-),score=41.95 TRINITY_DN2609_c0_g1_i3:324-803(-)
MCIRDRCSTQFCMAYSPSGTLNPADASQSTRHIITVPDSEIQEQASKTLLELFGQAVEPNLSAQDLVLLTDAGVPVSPDTTVRELAKESVDLFVAHFDTMQQSYQQVVDGHNQEHPEVPVMHDWAEAGNLAMTAPEDMAGESEAGLELAPGAAPVRPGA